MSTAKREKDLLEHASFMSTGPTAPCHADLSSAAIKSSQIGLAGEGLKSSASASSKLSDVTKLIELTGNLATLTRDLSSSAATSITSFQATRASAESWETDLASRDGSGALTSKIAGVS